MGNVVFHAVAGKFPFDLRIRSSRPIAQGIAALYHKAADNAVESQPVIKTIVCQIHKIGDGNRRCICIQL